MSFWTQLDQLRDMAPDGDREAIGALIHEIGGTCLTGDDALNAPRQALLEEMARIFDVTYVRPGPDIDPDIGPDSGLDVGSDIDLEVGLDMTGQALLPITTQARPGISLVTCCMNRTQNLLRALESWLACDDLSEVVIVDWSSDQPVRAALNEAGLHDPRIRIIRVEDEPRWILSFAFNVGFRAASCARILKVDADIVLDPDFFARNPLEEGQFIAGNWRRAAEGQAYVNGFFYLFKADLAAIAGFNEYITTYGWDDDEIYERLERHGVIRRDVDNDTIYHLPHSDEERVGEGVVGDESARAELSRDTLHKIRTNRFLAFAMPHWNNKKPVQPYRVQAWNGADLVLERTHRQTHHVPEHIREDAAFYALRELASWRLGPKAMGLDRDQLDQLLARPFADLGRIDLEVMLASTGVKTRAETRTSAGANTGYLVIRVGLDGLTWDGARVFDTLCDLANARGLTPVLSGPFAQLSESESKSVPEQALQCAFLPDWVPIGNPDLIGVAQLHRLENSPVGRHFQMILEASAIGAIGAIRALEGMELPAPDLSAPALATPELAPTRGRIFVDAQHGLGNRMRAIGSGATIAAKTGRELVVVWQPDDHCEGRLGDLFDYDGAVIEESFVTQARRDGAQVYNYMEVEEGAEKDAEIQTDGAGDIYVRSAYVLNSPFSIEEDENRFLRALTPVEEVRDMVAGVRHPNDVSVHVRMAGGADYEHLAYEAVGNWGDEGHAQIAHWREKSHFSHFIKRLETLISQGRAERIFLAADAPETYAEFGARFGNRIAMLERAVYDRSAVQLRYGLADALLLGRAPLLLGSTWSSFSELAMRLSPQEMNVEMSGKDF